MSTDNINWSGPFEIPNTNNFDVYARLVKDGQPVTEAIHSPKGQPVALQMGVRNQPPKPPASEWPEFAYTPDSYNTAVPGPDLEHFLRAHMDDDEHLVIIDEDSIGKLHDIAQSGDPSLLGNHIFTPQPGSFGDLPLTVKLGGDTEGNLPTFQGFRMVPSSLGYGARHDGKGSVIYRLCSFAGGYQGIAVTGGDADLTVHADYCTFDGQEHSSIYSVRGEVHATESVFTNVGHRFGEPRGPKSYLHHNIYAQWDCPVYVTNCFMRATDSHAVNARAGGSVNGLIAVRTANGIGFGHDKTDRPVVNGTINRAIIVNTEDLSDRKTGICVSGERASIKISNSLLADEKSAGDGSAFRLYDEARVELGRNVRTQGLPRIFDVSGSNTYASGGIRVTDTSATVVSRRPSASNHSGFVGHTITPPLTLPDFDRMTAPKPGYVGALIDGILNA